MSRPGNWLALVFAALCAGLGYGYWRDRLELEKLRAAQGASVVMERQDRKQIADLQRRVQAAATAEAARQQAAANGSGAGASGATVVHMSDIIKDHPEFAALNAKQVRRSVLRQFADAVASLHLPPDKAAQLKNLLVEGQLSQDDARQAALAAGMKQGSPEMSRATSQAYSEVQGEIEALVGPEGQAVLQRAGRVATMKQMIGYNYAPDFAEAGLPLTPDQEVGLAQALVGDNDPRTNPAVRDPGYREPNPDTWLSPADQATIARAAATLSPEQLEIFKATLAEETHRNAITQPYFRAAQGNSGGAIVIMQ